MNGRGAAPAALGLSSHSYAPGLLCDLLASAHEGDHCTPCPLHVRLDVEQGVLGGLTLLAASLNRPCHDSHILVFPVGLLPFPQPVPTFVRDPLHCPGRPCRGAFAQHL